MQENMEEIKEKKSKGIELPVLPLRDVVVYPKMIVPIFVGREKSIEAVQKANDKGLDIVLVMQKKADVKCLRLMIYIKSAPEATFCKC